jgi:formate dehydrogenase subunit gamma
MMINGELHARVTPAKFDRLYAAAQTKVAEVTA